MYICINTNKSALGSTLLDAGLRRSPLIIAELQWALRLGRCAVGVLPDDRDFVSGMSFAHAQVNAQLGRTSK